MTPLKQKIHHKIDSILFNKKSGEIDVLKEWKEQFKKFAWSFDESLSKLDAILQNINEPKFFDQTGMASIHWLLFSALSIYQEHGIQRILEIGTFEGQTTKILSKLFPNAQITTFDLPENDPLFKNTYSRESVDERQKFLDKQKRNTKSENIILKNVNSFHLLNHVNGNFDLVWVDGGHMYPEVAWDICNAFHLCSKNGWIMCDDIYFNKDPYDYYVGTESYEVIEYLKMRCNVECFYFLKRLKQAWFNTKYWKYVALILKK